MFLPKFSHHKSNKVLNRKEKKKNMLLHHRNVLFTHDSTVFNKVICVH